MPYTVQKRGSRYAVVNRRTRKVVGYSATKGKAQASARARQAGEKRSTGKKR